jgi:Lon-like ATP-dependent protease
MKESGLMEDPAEKAEGEQPPDDESANLDEIVKTPLDKYVHAQGVPESLTITTDAIKSLVRWYAREAGVRNLAKYINKITGKLALQVVAEEEGAQLTEKSKRKADSWVITEDNLSDYVGKPVFTSDRLYEDELPVGIMAGLAYTSLGGSALYIETQAIRRGLDREGKTRGGGKLKVTGQLGEVMKESAEIASTVARNFLAELAPESSFFDENDIHMHVPEGATPKDGPSAGITMTTSMLSLALNKPCRNNLAMTGEISLTGKVLPVGGIKEKVMAARRAGITTLVLPAANQRDFDEIPDYLREGLDVHYAEEYRSVYDVAFSQS